MCLYVYVCVCHVPLESVCLWISASFLVFNIVFSLMPLWYLFFIRSYLSVCMCVCECMYVCVSCSLKECVFKALYISLFLCGTFVPFSFICVSLCVCICVCHVFLEIALHIFRFCFQQWFLPYDTSVSLWRYFFYLSLSVCLHVPVCRCRGFLRVREFTALHIFPFCFQQWFLPHDTSVSLYRYFFIYHYLCVCMYLCVFVVVSLEYACLRLSTSSVFVSNNYFYLLTPLCYCGTFSFIYVYVYFFCHFSLENAYSWLSTSSFLVFKNDFSLMRLLCLQKKKALNGSVFRFLFKNVTSVSCW